VRYAVALLIPLVLGVSACGGDDREDVQSLLDRAFAKSIESADLRFDATLQIRGVPSLERPIRVRASGPFRGNEGKLPSTDMTLQIGTGGGQTVETGFLSTGDRAFVKFQDVYYEQPAAEVRKANESLRKGGQGDGRSLRSLGLDPRRWLAGARDRGEEKVAGVDTTHVSGTLDMTAILNDLNRFVRRSGGAIGGATGQRAPEPLSKEDVARFADVVRDPSFDVYVGEDDDTIRRVAGRLEVVVPEADRARIGGVQGGTLEFSLEFRDVNGDQKVEAPAKARPLSDLTKSLGTSGLRGLGGGGGGGSQSPEPGGTTTAPDQEAFKNYSECLEKADPNDTAELQRCAQLLQP
jgi:hypothetical protein